MANRLIKLSDIKSLVFGFSLVIAISSYVYAEEKGNCSDEPAHWSQTQINICTLQSAEESLVGLKKQISQYKSHWSPEAQKAFHAFEKARDQFISSHLENEMDWPLGTSGRPEAINEDYQALIQDESNFLARFEQGQFPTINDSDYFKQDKQLNTLYKTIQTSGVESDPPTGVSAQSIKKTQFIWLHYRDAWSNFAKIQYPKLSAQSWKAYITEKRVAMLRSFVVSSQE